MPAGAPTKLTEDFFQAVEDVLNTDLNVLVCTDDELLILINEKLSEKAKISERCFQNWKAGNFAENADGENFLRLIKRALVREKMGLMKRLQDDEKAWQRWAWIIERKFDEWNIKMKQGIEMSGKDGQPIPHSIEVKFE